ncbi:hypothetical protein ACSBOB_30390 [Mesorhizobium sp. ASY16-5R]|uniref:hypothetical protein n=1 Tax=Mesorhizobium sp. ASY16-5R TaxID=3445772 RepID=UPI003FA0941C
MAPKYLRDRYDVEEMRLIPERDRLLIEAMSSLGIHGTVFHVLRAIPEEYEDEYTILVDAKLVVDFELSREVPDPSPAAVKVWFLEEYRRDIGQGRRRILLDRAADAARKLIGQ